MRIKKIYRLLFICGVGMTLYLFGSYSEISENPSVIDIMDEHVETKENKVRKKDRKTEILWTQWRSGSSVLGSLIAESSSDTFYVYDSTI